MYEEAEEQEMNRVESKLEGLFVNSFLSYLIFLVIFHFFSFRIVDMS